MTVADRIKEERLKRGWTQEEMAKRCGYQWKTAISKIESSGDNISSRKIKLVASVFDVPVSYLMGWEEAQGTLANTEISVHRNLSEQETDFLQKLHDRSGMRMLFSSTDDATEEELEETARFLEYLKQQRK